MEQLNAGSLCDALETLSVLHVMLEKSPMASVYFNDVLLTLQALLEQSIIVMQCFAPVTLELSRMSYGKD
jgi:hypothetical protein